MGDALDPKWKATIDHGFGAADAHLWDSAVQAQVDAYNKELAGTKGYVSVDAQIVLSMLWVESGGPDGREWHGRVMQIGNAGDAGLGALQRHEGATSLVVPQAVLQLLADKKVDLSAPENNIKIGVAYLFTQMARSDEENIPDAADTAVHQHVVKSGESAWAIAQREGTTPEQLAADNPGVKLGGLHPGQMLSFRKARKGRQITGWVPFTPTNVAAYYNGGGDGLYADKLSYVLAKLRAKKAK